MNTRVSSFLAALLLTTTAFAQPVPTRDVPELAGIVTAKKASFAERDMVSAAHPLAVDAGLEMLARGGSAIDATIAVQLVLNLVESQSSGIGGGAFLMHHDASRNATLAYDGRETAPAAATPQLFLDADGKPMRFVDAVRSGKSVGVPGVLRALEAAHAAHGKLPWAAAFEPAIRLAEQGYPLGPRTLLHVVGNQTLLDQPEVRALYFNADGTPKALGTKVKNLAIAKVLRRIAAEGADAFYSGSIARNMVAAVRAHARPGTLSEADLAGYRVRISEPLCGNYRKYRLCGMPMPSSGGVAILQMLAMLERFDLSAMRPLSSESIHLFSEAARLAYADRDQYAADDRFADVPVKALLDPAYLRSRSLLIRPEKSMGRATAGKPASTLVALAADTTQKETGTSHFSVVDAHGNAVSMTTSVESFFGSQIFVDGFFLNNQLTDFSFTPTDANGTPVANAVYPGKRPRSTMAPFLVFDEHGKLLMVIGSPLGSVIVNLVAKSIIGVLDWKLDMQAAVALPNFGSRNGPTFLEKGSALEPLAPTLKAMGHEVTISDIPSGLHGILRVPGGWQGGADPRREGEARGR